MNREAIARIIDPDIWGAVGYHVDIVAADRARSLAKADQIIALSKADAILGLEETARPSSAQRGRGGDEAEPDHPDLDPINGRLA